MEFWSDRSKAEVALVLILMISFPFLIAMIITYLSLIMVQYEMIPCKEFCDYFNREMNTSDENINHNLRIAYRMYENSNCYESKNGIGHLIEKIYSDDWDYMVKCVVPILTKKFVLTSEQCLLERHNLKNFRIVPFTSQWTNGPMIKIKKVHNFFKNDTILNVILLETEDDLTLYSQCENYFMKIAEKSALQPTSDGNFGQIPIDVRLHKFSNLSKPLAMRKKYEHITLERFFLFQKNTSICSRYLMKFSLETRKVFCAISADSECKALHPTMSSFDFKLFGLSIKGFCDEEMAKTVFIFEEVHQYLDWITLITSNQTNNN